MIRNFIKQEEYWDIVHMDPNFYGESPKYWVKRVRETMELQEMNEKGEWVPIPTIVQFISCDEKNPDEKATEEMWEKARNELLNDPKRRQELIDSLQGIKGV
jgi:hypothetical protein